MTTFRSGKERLHDSIEQIRMGVLRWLLSIVTVLSFIIQRACAMWSIYLF